jgi:hydroxymethylpyrimidine/phosphomethylpyrimidine kinase
MTESVRACVLVFSGLDPSGGAGVGADIEAIAAQGAHALPIVTALTVQDNNRVREVVPVDAALLARQAEALLDAMPICAVKTGIPGSRENAEVIADIVRRLRARHPGLPVVVDPVLASGRGDALARGNALPRWNRCWASPPCWCRTCRKRKRSDCRWWASRAIRASRMCWSRAGMARAMRW